MQERSHLPIEAQAAKGVEVMSLLHNAFATISFSHRCNAWYQVAISL